MRLPARKASRFKKITKKILTLKYFPHRTVGPTSLREPSNHLPIFREHQAKFKLKVQAVVEPDNHQIRKLCISHLYRILNHVDIERSLCRTIASESLDKLSSSPCCVLREQFLTYCRWLKVQME